MILQSLAPRAQPSHPPSETADPESWRLSHNVVLVPSIGLPFNPLLPPTRHLFEERPWAY